MTATYIILGCYLLSGVAVFLANSRHHMRTIQKAISTKPDNLPTPVAAALLLMAVIILTIIDVVFWPAFLITGKPRP